MEEEFKTDYGKLAYLKTSDLTARLYELEKRGRVSREKSVSVKFYREYNKTRTFMEKLQLGSLSLPESGSVSVILKLRFSSAYASGSGQAELTLSESALVRESFTVNTGTADSVFLGAAFMDKNAAAPLSLTVFGFTGRVLLSVDIIIIGYNLTLNAECGLTAGKDKAMRKYIARVSGGRAKYTLLNSAIGHSWTDFGPAKTLFVTGFMKGTARQSVVFFYTDESGNLYYQHGVDGNKRLVDDKTGAACALPSFLVDNLIYLIYVKGGKAYRRDILPDSFSEPVPIDLPKKVAGVTQVIDAPRPMFVFTCADGTAIMKTGEDIREEA